MPELVSKNSFNEKMERRIKYLSLLSLSKTISPASEGQMEQFGMDKVWVKCN